MNVSERSRKRVLKQMMEFALKDKLTIMSPHDNPKIPYKMSEFDFRNTLLDFPMTIPPDDLAHIVEYYKEGRYINYEKFVDDLLSSVKTDEQNPPDDMNSTKETMKITIPKKINPHYIALARFLAERNTNLSSIVQDMDRNNIGVVTAENFARVLTDFPEANDVARIAMDIRTHEINYLKLEKLLKSIDIKSTNVTDKKPVESSKLPSCFPEFVHLIKTRSIHLDDVFTPLNKTKTGLLLTSTKLPRDKFFSTLYQLNLPFSRANLEKITDFFVDKNGQVDYEKFIATIHFDENDTFVPPPPQYDIEKAVQKIIKFFVDRKLNVWSLFKPYDRSGTGKVPRTLFLKTLNGFSFDMDTEELRLAVESISDEETNTVDYVEFAKQVYRDNNIDFDRTIDSALQRLREFLMNKRVMLHKYLGKYDRDKSGLISTNQFLASLRKMGYQMDDNDFRLVRETYEDKQTRHYIQWRKLCEDVDITYGDQNLSSNSSVSSLSGSSSASFTGSMRDLLTSTSKQMQLYKMQDLNCSGNPTESGPIPDDIIPLFAQIEHAISKFGFDLEGELISCDRFKKGVCQRTQFKQILDLLPMTINPNQLEKLIRFYCDESTGKVYYLNFIKDLDEFGNQDNQQQEEEQENEPIEPTTINKEEEDEEPATKSATQSILKEKTNTLSSIKSWAGQQFGEKTETYDMRNSQSIDGLPEAIKPLLNKILEYTHVHSSTPREIFHDCDKYHNGMIEKASLQRAFGPTGIYITPAEFDLLVETFGSTEKPDYVNYLRICNAIQAINRKENQIGMLPLGTDDEQSALITVNRIKTSLGNRRKTLRMLFANEQSDVVSPKVLFDKLENVAGLSLVPEERRLLQRKYHVNANGDIDWKKLCYDAEQTIRLV